MAVTLTGTYGYFTRLGTLGTEQLRVVTAYSSALTTAISNIRAQWANNTDAQVLDNLFSSTTSWQNVHSSYLNYLQSVSQANTIAQVNDDTPLSNQTLSNALTVLISQIKVADSVQVPTTSTTITPWASNKSDAILVASLINEFGDTLDVVYPETLTFTCTGDTSSGNALYSESFSITGPATVPVYASSWPQGSGASGSIQLKDAVLAGLIQNGGFKTFTVANTPDNWSIRVGSAGTQILQDSSAKRGTSCLKIVSDGSTLTAIKQQLSSSLVKPDQVIIFNSWMKVSTLDSGGVITVRLTDGNGTTLVNDVGGNCSKTFGTNGGTGMGTSYTNLHCAFSTPRQLPSSGVFLDIQLSTSTTSGHNINIDLVGLAVGQQLYPQGPYVQMFSTATASILRDYFSLAITNGATNATWVRFGQRVLGMPQLGNAFYWPSTNSPTILDSLL